MPLDHPAPDMPMRARWVGNLSPIRALPNDTTPRSVLLPAVSWHRALDEGLDLVGTLRVDGLVEHPGPRPARQHAIASVLARGTDVVKAVAHYQRATRLDPSDPEIWDEYASRGTRCRAHGRSQGGIQQAELKAQETNNPNRRYWAMLGQGDVEVAQGNLPVARELYARALGIAEPIAKAKPENAGWQRDLSVSYDKIGDLLRAQGNLPEALGAYKASFAIAERLAKADLGNGGWQRDLSVSHNKIGDVLRAQGNLPETLAAYKASLAIRDRLAKADPGNAGWQRDLALSHGRVATILVQQGERERGLGSLRQGREIILKLKAASPSNATLPEDLAWFDGQIVGLQKR